MQSRREQRLEWPTRFAPLLIGKYETARTHRPIASKMVTVTLAMRKRIENDDVS
jgi:hypothetical protein